MPEPDEQLPTATLPRAALVIVAAGVGSRMATGTHKALVEIAGRPLIAHTLATLLPVAWLDPIVLVGHRDDRDALTELIADLPRPVTLVDGGAERQDSVLAGLEALAADAPACVLIHDGARPFVPVTRLAELTRAAQRFSCALLAVPVADTIKRAADGDLQHSAGTVDRSRLRAAQTPQAFDRTRLATLLAAAARDGQHVTDEAALFEAAGLPPRFVEGSPRNLKITTAEDLQLAAALLALRDRGTRAS